MAYLGEIMKTFLLLLIAVLMVYQIASNPDKEKNGLEISVKALQTDLSIEKEKIKILSCESGFRHSNIWGDNGKSFGIAQFQLKTFDSLKIIAGRPELQWENQKDQLWLLDWALRHNYGKYWTCASINTKKVKFVPKIVPKVIPKVIPKPVPKIEEEAE